MAWTSVVAEQRTRCSEAVTLLAPTYKHKLAATANWAISGCLMDYFGSSVAFVAEVLQLWPLRRTFSLQRNHFSTMGSALRKGHSS